MDAEAVALRVFGVPSLRPGQAEAVRGALAGRDVCVYLPTGAGKSLCFQLPALLRPGVVLVISPLIALMADQCAALHRRGVRAAFLSSTPPAGTNRDTLLALAAQPVPELDLLYVAPEALPNGRLLSVVQGVAQRGMLTLLAVDEAHCVSTWGHDFRPAYRHIGSFRARLGSVPVMACSATASASVRHDLVQQLRLGGGGVAPLEVRLPFDRPEIYFCVLLKDAMPDAEDAYDHLLRQLQGTSKENAGPSVNGNAGPAAGAARAGFVRASALPAEGVALAPPAQPAPPSGGGGCAIVYCSTRDACAVLASRLVQDGVRARAYHAGLSSSARAAAQAAWASGEVQVVVATVAFGMGIDKADVRTVSYDWERV
jgi:bloom syndrome protein